MLEIVAGAVRAYYLFDVADTIDLAKMSALGGDNRAPAALPLRPHAQPYLQFPVPPLVAALPDATIGDLRCSVRLKLYDYGVDFATIELPGDGDVERPGGAYRAHP